MTPACALPIGSQQRHDPPVSDPTIERLFVSAERLGWPPRRRWWLRWVPWETQTRMVYEDRAEEPSATCHLQRDDRENALCGYEWEGLVMVPGHPQWTDLHPEMRCDECSKAAAFDIEHPAG